MDVKMIIGELTINCKIQNFIWIFIWIYLINSGADNSNNSSNPDTSMKFGKKHPYVILFQNQS